MVRSESYYFPFHLTLPSSLPPQLCCGPRTVFDVMDGLGCRFVDFVGQATFGRRQEEGG